MTELRIAPDVAAMVGEQDLADLQTAAAHSYDCLTCGTSSSLADGPASVVVLRSESLAVARLAHAACHPSGVVDLLPGALRVAQDAPAVAVAAVLPHASGPRPVLLVEPSASMSVLDAPERVDLLTAGLLRKGLHMVSSAGRTPEPAVGWRVQLTGPAALRVVDPHGGELYDGEVGLPDGWLQLVDASGDCVLLCASGLGLAEGLDVAEGLRRLNAMARAGRLVGARVPVTRAAPAR